jgi:protein-tyrosine phosphatase
MTTSTATEITIDGLVNIRDLGGLCTADGKTLRSGVIFRSDSLKALTETGQADLERLVAPRTVIDLRMGVEVTRDGYELRDASVNIINFPMIPLSGVNQQQIDEGAYGNLIDDYMGQIDVNALSILSALQMFADSANHPVVLHCTAGKDRTGVAVAMALEILGVDHETIAADYHVTTANMAPIVARIKANPVFQANGLADAPDWVFESEPATMLAFLARMTEDFGSGQEWAIEKGMTLEQIEAMRANLLED